MSFSVDAEALSRMREAFFKVAFGPDVDGWVCIGYLNKTEGWKEFYFNYPSELPRMLAHIEQRYESANVYFCPQLLNDPKFKRQADGKGPRVKENIKTCTSAWADLDSCNPDLLLVKPSIVVESSSSRYQALWVFDEAQGPDDAQQISKNIAYHHVPDGADRGGWDLTQMLRVPYTYNRKYDPVQPITILSISRDTVQPEAFKVYRESRINAATHTPMPEVLPTEEPLDILQRYRRSLNPVVFNLFATTPTSDTDDWSKLLWQLQMLAFEAGLSREEVFVVASAAACNKYQRDNKHPRLLWEEVCRAYETTIEKLNVIVPEDQPKQALISPEELESIAGYESFVERYIAWAGSLGDAAKQYHQAGGFIVLSSILAGSVRLPTSFGTIQPNLWFMLLADTTLTRKSTAMDIAADLLDEVDPDTLLATDGSIEGLMGALELRPGRPSLFLRDEVSGLIEAMSKKDYMAGMAEALTKLYDGKTMKRVLRRETVTVRDPCMMFFAGGIKTRVQSLLTLDHVSSGFVPRFIFITAESDITKLEALGPPTASRLEGRDALMDEIRNLKDTFVRTQDIMIRNTIVGVQDSRIDAYLTPEAWDRYGRLEATLLYAGVNSQQPDIMTPVYDRLSKSILKAAVLLAASRKPNPEEVRVDVEDLLAAIKYGQDWKKYNEEVVNGIGSSTNEIILQRVLKTIRSHPNVTRAQLMRWYHMESRQADVLFGTLEQRGLVIATRMGRTCTYEALGRIQTNDRQA